MSSQATFKSTLVSTVLSATPKPSKVIKQTYIYLGSQGAPVTSKPVFQKHQQEKRRILRIRPQDEVASESLVRKYHSLTKRREDRRRMLSRPVASTPLSELSFDNFVRLFGYGPHRGKVAQLMAKSAWAQKLTSWRQHDKSQQVSCKRQLWDYRRAFWHSTNLSAIPPPSESEGYVWPKIRREKKVRVPRLPKVDHSAIGAAARVLYETCPPPPRSKYLAAKLRVLIMTMVCKRKASTAWSRFFKRGQVEDLMTQWGSICPKTKGAHHYTWIPEHRVMRCVYCGATRTRSLGDHECGLTSKLKNFIRKLKGQSQYCPIEEGIPVLSCPGMVYNPTTMKFYRTADHQMDIQNDPVGEVGQVQEAIGNVTLEQQSTTLVVAEVGKPVTDTACAPEVVDACPEIIERGLCLGTITWNSTQKVDTELQCYNLMSSIFDKLKQDQTPNLLMFEPYRYCKLDVELIFSANTTMFHTGLLQISATYLREGTLETSDYNNIYTLSQRHHVILNAGAGNEVQIKVPFDYYKNYLYMDADNTEGGKDFATVLVKVLTPLRVGGQDTTSVDIMVYAKLSRVNFTGMIPRAFKTFDHQMDIIGPATRVVSALLADPNRDYPSVPGARIAMQPQSSQSLCYGTNCDLPLTTLRLDPSVQTPHPQRLVDFDVKKVVSVWGLIKVLEDTYTLSKNIGDQLWTTEVSPILPPDSLYKVQNRKDFDPGTAEMSLATYAHPPVSVIASMFGYWSGSIKFKFQIVQTKFHSGRIIVGFIPGKIPNNYTVTIKDLRNSLHTVYNIQDSNEFVFEVPYLNHTPVQPRRYVNGTFGSNFPSIGQLYVMVANRLALSENVPKNVTINVYMCGSPNLEFFLPVAPSLVPATHRTVKVRGVIGHFKDGYEPQGVGVWHAWALDGKEYPIVRYGDGSDHISQYECNVFGVYDFGPMSFKMWAPKVAGGPLTLLPAQWGVPVKFDGYVYMLTFPTEPLAKSYIDRVSLSAYVRGVKQRQLKVYSSIISPPPDTTTVPTFAGFGTKLSYPCTYALFDHEMSDRTTQSAVSIVNVKPARPLGRSLFGERPCNLKDLARRYQFLGSFRKKDSDIHDNPLYTDVIFPVCPNYVHVDAPPYDRLGLHPTALLATGYRGFRGSIRYKLVYRGEADATIYIQHRFDARPREVQQKLFVHGLDDLIGTGYATMVQHTKVNPVIDFEVPYYSIYNYLLVGTPKGDLNDHEKTRVCNGNLLISVDSTHGWTIDVWSAFGDDASYHMFQGFPPMGYSSGLPIDLVPEHAPPRDRRRRDSEASFEVLREGDHEGLLDYVPGYSFVKKAERTVDNVDSVATSLRGIVDTAKTAQTVVAKKCSDIYSFITSIPSLILSLGDQVWQALLQMVQVYLNPTAKSLAVCIVSMLLGICSYFKDYADQLFSIVFDMLKGKDLLTALSDSFDSDDEDDIVEFEMQSLDLLNCGSPTMFDLPQPDEGSKNCEKPKRRIRTGDHQMDAEEDTWIPMASLLVTAISGACGRKISTSSPKHLVKTAISSIPDQARSTMFVMKYIAIIVSLVKVATDYVKRKLYPEVVHLDVPDKSITAWYSLVCELTDVTQYDRIRSDQSKINQVYAEVKRGDSIVVLAAASKDVKIKNVLGILRTKLNELKKVKQRLFDERICSTSYTTPFCVWMYGRPGIGKSVGGAKIRKDLLTSAGIKCNGEVSYTISPGKKHLDGLTNQPCVIFDDFGAIDDATTTPEVIQMYMEMISSEPYRPPMAALEDKKIIHNAEIVYINSNFSYPRYACVQDSDAFNRRRHALVWMRAKGDTINMAQARARGPVTLETNPEMTPGKLDHLQFAFLDPSDPSSDESIREEDFLDYDAFIELLRVRFNDHRDRARALAEERMASEAEIRYQNEEVNRSFADIRATITRSLFQTAELNVADHQMNDRPVIVEYDSDEEIPQASAVRESRPSTSAEAIDQHVHNLRVAAGARTFASTPHQMLGDAYLEAEASVSHYSNSLNTPEGNRQVLESLTSLSSHEFVMERSRAIRDGVRLNTTVCKHNIFSTAMEYENGVFIGNGFAIGNQPCDASKFPTCKWLDRSKYVADMMAWWVAHESFVVGLMNACSGFRPITDEDIPPYFVQMFDSVQAEQKLLAEAESSWLKYIQYFIMVKIPNVIHSILNFVQKHWLAIAIISYVAFLFSMMGVAVKTGVAEAESIALQNECIKQQLNTDFTFPRNRHSLKINTPQTPRVPTPPGVHQIIPSGDNTMQRPGNARRITRQLQRGDHQLELHQKNKDVLRLVSGNTWFMCLVNYKDEITCDARVIALRGQKILIIRHYIEAFKAKLKDDPTLRLCLVRPSCCLPWHESALDTVKYMKSDGTGSYGVIDGPTNMPLARDITKLIAPAKMHDSVDLSACVLMETNIGIHPNELIPTLYPVSSYISSVLATARDGMSEVIYEDSYFYPVSCRGLCGSVLISNGFVIGVHVCGSNGEGVAEPICKDWFVEQVDKTIKPVFPPSFLPVEQAQLLLSSSNLPLGVCDPKFAHHESGKTKIVPSKIAGVFPIRTQPAPLTKHDPRLEGEHIGRSPMREGCEKHGQLVEEFPASLLQEAYEDLSSLLCAVVQPARGKVGVLSLSEAIMGFPGRSEYQKMEMNTSEGYPWVSRRPKGAHNKSWMFSFGVDPDTNLETLEGINDELLAVLSVNDNLRKQNCRPFTVYTDCLKDARLPIDKCKRADKTRVFSISPVDHTIACRQYFLDFSASYQLSRFRNECGVGIVVQGAEWTKLHTYLTTLSPYIVCGDYSNFGPGLQSGVVRAAFKIIADWYEYHGATEEETRVRRVLAEENINSIHQMFNLIYATCGGAPSGNPLTVIINSLVNCLYIRMAWKAITQLPMCSMRDNVRLVTYGDDLIMSVHEAVIDKFNNQSLQNFFSSYNIKYTDIDKGDGTIRKWCTISEASFLKRTWIPHPTRRGQFLACAELASIEDCANWIRDSPDSIQATEINAATCCDIAYSRGKEYHTTVVNQVRQAWNKRVLRTHRSVEPLKLRTWDELDALYYSDKWEGQPWTEHFKLMLSHEQ